MLAQSFKTADELGITEPQRAALAKTLVLLETGKLRHVETYLDFDLGITDLKFSGEFNMDHWSAPHPCGTVACIGGTAELVGGLPPDSLEDSSFNNEKLNDLFYPNNSEGFNLCSYRKITPAQAAIALRSYLTCGNARWEDALR